MWSRKQKCVTCWSGDVTATIMSKPVSWSYRFSWGTFPLCELTVWCVRLQSTGSAFVPVGPRVAVGEWHIRVSHPAPLCGLWTAAGRTLSGRHLHAEHNVSLLHSHSPSPDFLLLAPGCRDISSRKPSSARFTFHSAHTESPHLHIPTCGFV